MAQNHFNLHLLYRCSLLLGLIVLCAPVLQAQSGAGVDSTGTGGRHSINGRVVFPSGQRADTRLKVRLESPGQGDLTVLSDINGNFTFRSLKAGNYTVIIEGGDFFEEVRESVYIEPATFAPRTTPGIVPVSRPFTLQIYLREKAGTQTRPGVLNAALANVPKASIEFYEKGVENANRHETDKAIEDFKRAIALYPNFALALNDLGVQYLRKGELDKAAEVLEKVLRLSPDAPEPNLNYGIVLLQQRKYVEAEGQLRNAVKKNDHAFTAHLYFGIALIHVKNYTEAESELRRAITIGGPKVSQAHYYLGGMYWQTGKSKEAADELEMFLKLEPKAANADKVRSTIKELRKS
ncbi:MAG TPA: tetratricopeptide repeat protein [Pyrinomonadaceae bacterium]|nr:tetratricopeptide repeat protein [Pyrinomonadaceae bacterium]